ncbi:MAG: 2-oxoacid:ferredoxin oxidoreductase subunit gamma [Euryarchaeota archaeon]
MRREVRISGFGGQGVILAGVVLGRAAAVYEGYNAVQTQSYGPEARGGASRSDVIVSDEEIMYPYVRRPHYLVTMSQEAYDRYAPRVREDGLIVYDSTLVEPSEEHDVEHVGVPATRIAEERLGLRIVANMVILGALRELTDLVSEEALKRAVRDAVPPGTEEINVKAVEQGARGIRE